MLVKRRVYVLLVVVAGLLVAAVFALRPRGDTVVYQGKSIREWAIAASAGDTEAIAALRSLDTNAIPGLVDLLQRQESFARRQLTAITSRLPGRLGGRAFSWASRKDTIRYRSAAARSLGLLGPVAEPAIPVLIGALRDPETQVRWDAAGALGRIGQPAVPELLRVLAESGGFARNCAAYALGQIGAAAEPALPQLIESFTDTNRDLRASAAYSAAAIGAPSMLALSNVLYHGDPGARDLAAKELVRFQRSLRIPIPALARMAQAPEAASRQMAIAALGALRIADNTAFTAVTNALRDEVPEVRLAALQCLKGMVWRAHEALPLLILQLKDPSPAVREWAVSTLGDIGPRASSAVPRLKQLIEEEAALEPRVRDALEKIGAK